MQTSKSIKYFLDVCCRCAPQFALKVSSKRRATQKTIALTLKAKDVCVISLLFVTQGNLVAQDTVSYTYQSVGLEIDTDNEIQNASHLDDVFESLYQLRARKDRQVSIIHIGDSHIQGDYLTQPIRRNFQRRFGNAGRGLIIPGRVASTNESFNIVTCSEVFWNSKRCSYPDQPLPIGVSGITISTAAPNATLDIYMRDLWLDYKFNKVKLFYLKDSSAYNFILRDTLNKELGRIEFKEKDPVKNYSTAILSRPVEAIRIETVKGNSFQNQATIFGLSLENGASGVLYHSIGVNGAKYKHYNAAQFFAEQTAALKPLLIIVSLGTNEALDYPHLDVMFFQHLNDLITSLKQNNPNAKFILTTPPEAYRLKTEPNPGIKKIRERILQYAVDNGLSFYDTYKALGGEHSAKSWRECGYLRADGIHFSREAYEYQANLFFNAFIKSYNRYVQLRHP
jgi:lysophospholipase L1-like esterase